MEHILNIAFDFDDNRVRNVIERQACEQVISKLSKDIENALAAEATGRYYNRDQAGDGIAAIAKARVDRIIDDNKDVIIQEAAKQLADRLMRTKAVKNAVEAAVKEL